MDAERALPNRVLMIDTIPQKELRGRFLIGTGDSRVVVNISDVEWLEAKRNHICLHLSQTSHTIRLTLKLAAAALTKHGFLRVNRDAVVNLRQVTQINGWRSREAWIVLASGATVCLGRHYRRAFVRAYDNPFGLASSFEADRSSALPKANSLSRKLASAFP